MWTALTLATLLSAGSADPTRPGADDPAALVRSAASSIRAGRLEDARRAYLEAARLSPLVQDWLVLRAAELTPDSSARQAAYARIRTVPALGRIEATEAGARERLRDFAGAATRYQAIGRPVDAIRVRLQIPGADRPALRKALNLLIHDGPPASAAAAASLLLTTFAPLTPEEALGVARTATATGQTSRAAAQYRVGLKSRGATAADSVAYGRALFRLRRAPEAIAVLDRISATSSGRAAADLERARADVRLGNRAAAISRLRASTAKHRTAEARAEALLLLGDLAWDDGDLETARASFLAIGRDHPTSEHAHRGRFLAALAAWRLGQHAAAAAEWGQLRADAGTGEIAAAAEYWQGKALFDSGDRIRASAVWSALRQRDSASYYSVAAAERLGVPPWTAGTEPDRFVTYPDIDSAKARIEILERIGLAPEAGWEREWLVEAASGSVERLLTTAKAFHQIGRPMTAIRLARSALAASTVPDGRTYRLLYPFPLSEQVREMATKASVDPWLVAALTRQESAWDPKATSRAGARGLMQVMPATGALVAKRLNVARWHPDSLYAPTLNLQIGIRYLAERLDRCQGDHVCALAGYNAGPARIAKWMQQPGAEDRDFLIERMAFAETRDYVRTVRRNIALYRALYGTAGAIP